MKDCIFCKIVKGKIKSYKFWENKEFIAILDLFPNCKGQTLVISKKHYHSDVLSLDKKIIHKFLDASKRVSNLLKKKLKVKRVALVIEGTGINHAHIKLYPLHGLKSKFQEFWNPRRVYFKKYKGYITTLLGPKADEKELKRLAKFFTE